MPTSEENAVRSFAISNACSAPARLRTKYRTFLPSFLLDERLGDHGRRAFGRQKAGTGNLAGRHQAVRLLLAVAQLRGLCLSVEARRRLRQ
jgi:hypothetical protein